MWSGPDVGSGADGKQSRMLSFHSASINSHSVCVCGTLERKRKSSQVDSGVMGDMTCVNLQWLSEGHAIHVVDGFAAPTRGSLPHGSDGTAGRAHVEPGELAGGGLGGGAGPKTCKLIGSAGGRVVAQAAPTETKTRPRTE